MKPYFEGQYYKHQKDDKTLSIIVGRTKTERFIQVITDQGAYKVPIQKGNYFSNQGIALNIKTPQLTLRGAICYHQLSPISGDIMGPFRFFPMECRHGIVSMRHRLTGSVVMNGEVMDFTGGLGYMETDSGCSFPSEYTWIQANDFSEPCSVVAAVARIPFCGMHFRGCICVIQYQGREYRLATYRGVRVLACTSDRIVLAQGPYRLDIRVGDKADDKICDRNSGGISSRNNKINSYELAAPQQGQMVRTIQEAVSCPAQFRFSIRGQVVFDFISRHASFEYEPPVNMKRL